MRLLSWIYNKAIPEKTQTVDVGKITAVFEFDNGVKTTKVFKGRTHWSDLTENAWTTDAQTRMDGFMEMCVREGIVYIDETLALPIHRLKDIQIKREELKVTVSNRD